MNPEDFSLSKWDDFQVIAAENSAVPKEAYEQFKTFKKIASLLPKTEIVKRGWMENPNDIASLAWYYTDFVSGDNRNLYRKSLSADEAMAAFWVSRVKREAREFMASVPLIEFKTLDLDDLKQIAKLSADPDVVKALPEILAKKGVVLIYLRSFPKMKVDGVVFKLASGNPVIGLSLRYSRLDNFWFTLMHELSHVVLHYAVLSSPIVNDLEEGEENKNTIEVAANRLAKAAFVERQEWRSCEPKYNKSVIAIERFAKKIHVHPSIVAGMLRREEGEYRSYSKIVNSVNVREILFGHD
jgi:HTH-type transcriptional regulator/antitoxin HigA